MASKKKSDARKIVPEVTAKQLEVMGSRLDGRRVKLSNCIFHEVDNLWVSNLKLELAIAEREQEFAEYGNEWVGFCFSDRNSDPFDYGFVSMDMMGEFVTSIKRGAPIEVEGTVVQLWAAILIVDRLRVQGKMNKLQW